MFMTLLGHLVVQEMRTQKPWSDSVRQWRKRAVVSGRVGHLSGLYETSLHEIGWKMLDV